MASSLARPKLDTASDISPRELAELQNRVAWQEQLISILLPTVVALAERVDAMPPPRFEVPRGWLTAKQAMALSGFSLPTIYRMVRTPGQVVGVKIDGLLRIDPASLPARK